MYFNIGDRVLVSLIARVVIHDKYCFILVLHFDVVLTCGGGGGGEECFIAIPLLF